METKDFLGPRLRCRAAVTSGPESPTQKNDPSVGRGPLALTPDSSTWPHDLGEAGSHSPTAGPTTSNICKAFAFKTLPKKMPTTPCLLEVSGGPRLPRGQARALHEGAHPPRRVCPGAPGRGHPTAPCQTPGREPQRPGLAELPESLQPNTALQLSGSSCLPFGAKHRYYL